MKETTFASVVSGGGSGSEDERFRRRIRLLLHFGDFSTAIAEICERPHWETDPQAVLQLGNVVKRFALRSQDRRPLYRWARDLYRRAAALTDDPALRADGLAYVGAAYLEEGRLDEANGAYARSLVLEPASRCALLGRLSVACAKRDLDTVRASCGELTTRIPTWHRDRELVAILATDPDYAFLRSSGELFFECFGGLPEDLQAVHDTHRVAALQGSVHVENDNPDPLAWRMPHRQQRVDGRSPWQVDDTFELRLRAVLHEAVIVHRATTPGHRSGPTGTAQR